MILQNLIKLSYFERDPFSSSSKFSHMQIKLTQNLIQIGAFEEITLCYLKGSSHKLCLKQ